MDYYSRLNFVHSSVTHMINRRVIESKLFAELVKKKKWQKTRFDYKMCTIRCGKKVPILRSVRNNTQTRNIM